MKERTDGRTEGQSRREGGSNAGIGRGRDGGRKGGMEGGTEGWVDGTDTCVFYNTTATTYSDFQLWALAPAQRLPFTHSQALIWPRRGGAAASQPLPHPPGTGFLPFPSVHAPRLTLHPPPFLLPLRYPSAPYKAAVLICSYPLLPDLCSVINNPFALPVMPRC